MKTVTFPKPAAPSKLFASVRGSRDVSLVAFGAALLAAAALHLGAFLPRLTAPEAPRASSLAASAAPAPAAIVASQPAPRALPRG